MLEYKVTDDHTGVRLDKYLKKTLASVPFSHLFKMIRVKKIRVNGKRAQPEQELVAGDVITVRGTDAQLLGDRERKPAPAPEVDLSQLDILFEDDWIIALNKPSGMAAHTGSGITGGTVVDVVRAYLGAEGRAERLLRQPRPPARPRDLGHHPGGQAPPGDGALHRGLHRAQGEEALPGAGEGQAAEDLPGSSTCRSRSTSRPPSRASAAASTCRRRAPATRWCVKPSHAAFVQCTIETGRTHQIRRHFAAIGHPVAGDPKHGDFAFNREVKAQWGLKRLFLHSDAARISAPGRRAEDGG